MEKESIVIRDLLIERVGYSICMLKKCKTDHDKIKWASNLDTYQALYETLFDEIVPYKNQMFSEWYEENVRYLFKDCLGDDDDKS